MTSRQLLADTCCQADIAWQKTCEQFLDNGREPCPLDWRSVLLISAFFALTWGLSTWTGRAQFIPAISAATIVSFASLRSSSFDRAYRQYLERRKQVRLQMG